MLRIIQPCASVAFSVLQRSARNLYKGVFYCFYVTDHKKQTHIKPHGLPFDVAQSRKSPPGKAATGL